MSPIFPIPPLRNAPNTLVFLNTVSFMPWQNSISREKKSLGYKEQCPEKRATYEAELADAIHKENRSPVYIDESGFAAETVRRHGYAPRGIPVKGTCSSQRYREHLLDSRTNPGRFQSPPGYLRAPVMRHVSINGLKHIYVRNSPMSTSLLWINAPWHKTLRTAELIATRGAKLLYLPPYSPDLNPIEHDFANIKKRWEYQHDQPIENIIKMYK